MVMQALGFEEVQLGEGELGVDQGLAIELLEVIEEVLADLVDWAGHILMLGNQVEHLHQFLKMVPVLH